MEIFTDYDLGKYDLPGALMAAGLKVHVHADYFPPHEIDRVWLPAVAEKGWIILTSDKKIRSRFLELECVMTAGARVIGLVGGHLKTLELAHNFLNTLSEVEAFIEKHPAPWLARLTRPNPPEGIALGRPGKIQLAYDLETWKRRGI